jgi:hypothetical protein
MANQLLTISMITAESARVLSNNLVLSKTVNRSFDEDFGIKGAKIGQTINVRKPARYDLRTGSVVDLQAYTQTYATLTFTDPIGVDLDFTSQEKTFSLDLYSENVIKSAVTRVANGIDKLGYDLVNSVYNASGTPAVALTTSTARDAVLATIAQLYENDAPVEDGMLSFINSPSFNGVLSGSNSALFNPTKEISEIYIKGFQGEFGGAKHYMSQLVPSHTVGTYGGTPLTNAATAQTGASLITDGWTVTSTVLKVGDIFTIDGCYAVNPQTKSALSYLQQFVVTADTVTDGSGNSTIAISPAIVASGPFQNVSTPAANNKAITVLGASTAVGQQSIGFHRDAFMLANKDLIVPTGGVESAFYVRDPQSNIGVRVVEAFDVRTNQHITRLDSMVAWAVLYPQLASRLYVK